MSAVIGLKKASEEIRSLDQKTKRNMARAINTATRKVRTQGSRDIRDEVRLPAGYVNQHLKVAKQANAGSLVSIIRATSRPVMLARYGAKPITKAAPGAKGNPSVGVGAGRKQVGVSVHVGRGQQRKRMPGALLIRLSGGNLGVAMRTAEGLEVKYGPSVAQIFNNTREELIDSATDSVMAEFHRLTKARV